MLNMSSSCLQNLTNYKTPLIWSSRSQNFYMSLPALRCAKLHSLQGPHVGYIKYCTPERFIFSIQSGKTLPLPILPWRVKVVTWGAQWHTLQRSSWREACVTGVARGCSATGSNLYNTQLLLWDTTMRPHGLGYWCFHYLHEQRGHKL